MTYAERYQIAVGGGATPESAVLLQQVAVAVAVAAVNVMSEAPATENHAARLTWATRALGDALQEGRRMVWGVLANPTVAQSPLDQPDDTIQFVINSLVDAYARLP